MYNHYICVHELGVYQCKLGHGLQCVYKQTHVHKYIHSTNGIMNCTLPSMGGESLLPRAKLSTSCNTY